MITGDTSNSRLAFVDIDTPNRKVLAAIHFEFSVTRRGVFSSIASIYSKPNLAVVNLINEAYYKNEVYHANTERIKNWLTKSQGLQLPLVGLASNKSLSKEDWLSVTGQLQLLPRIKANLSGANVNQKVVNSKQKGKKSTPPIAPKGKK